MATTETRKAVAETPVTGADPGPLGLAGFAATTLVLGVTGAGLIDKASIGAVLPLALFYGGLGQLIAGILEFRRGNTFGTTAFTTYGGFWLAFAFLNWSAFTKGAVPGPGVGMFLLVFAIVTGYLTIAALRVSGAVLVVFVLLTLAFLVLSISNFAGSDSLGKLGGWVAIVTAVAAFYASAAIVINTTWRRVVLPVFPFTA
jgi:hypothetical protein